MPNLDGANLQILRDFAVVLSEMAKGFASTSIEDRVCKSLCPRRVVSIVFGVMHDR